MERLTLFNLRQRSRSVEPQTQTILDQLETEQKVRKAYYEKLSQWKDKALQLFKVHHINYLTRKLVNLPTSFESLDSSQPWLAYWMVHSLRLLNFTIPDETKQQLVHFLASTQHPDGGFGGGPYQFAHLAPTYGAVNCLVLLCRADALQIIDRVKLADWLRRLRQPDGSLLMHIGGESDVRGAYCAVAVAKLTGLLDKHPDLFKGTAEWVARCQTYEGGYGAQPGIEAHGGYTFCAAAALCLLGRADFINIPRLLHWVAHRQMASEGGFQVNFIVAGYGPMSNS
ncbi:Farnesyltransferase subunit beta [Fasciolopsis buskii]|uniref:Farnesyltransferase subunit beta n=1 Tax=Fasciolopsis buskii TaxID=27845 RepID=A0A8E0RYA5_9TREM|nr:Farnesyltransferase subunit beta [Fasciolopsis buski]